MGEMYLAIFPGLSWSNQTPMLCVDVKDTRTAKVLRLHHMHMLAVIVG